MIARKQIRKYRIMCGCYRCKDYFKESIALMNDDVCPIIDVKK